MEGFHNPLSNFANTGMNRNLADNLNHEGTARYNVVKRHRLRMAALPASKRPDIPSSWVNWPSYYNHSWLNHVNKLAVQACYPSIPFKTVETLPPDNGERFFSEYWVEQLQRQRNIASHPLNDRCQCQLCANNPADYPATNDSTRSP